MIWDVPKLTCIRNRCCQLWRSKNLPVIELVEVRNGACHQTAEFEVANAIADEDYVSGMILIR